MADRRQRDEDLERLTAYLDGELSEADRANVERWLARDPQAARLFEELRRTSQRVTALPRAAAPADLAKRIADRLEREALLGDADALGGSSREPLRWMRPLSLAAGFVLVVTAGWLLWPQVHQKKSTESPMTLVQAPPAAPTVNNESMQSSKETALALGDQKDETGQRRSANAKTQSRKERGFLKDDRFNAAPLALAKPVADKKHTSEDEAVPEIAVAAGQDAGNVEANSRIFSSAGQAAGVMRQLAKPTSAPATASAPTTSAPTTTSAPATSQPTTRSAP